MPLSPGGMATKKATHLFRRLASGPADLTAAPSQLLRDQLFNALGVQDSAQDTVASESQISRLDLRNLALEL